MDPEAADLAKSSYECLRPYSNNLRGVTGANYAQVPAPEREQCRRKMAAVHEYVFANRAELEAATSPRQYEFALRSARLAMQGEDVRARWDNLARDRYMAENAAWWLEQAGPGAKMVICAHNAHVSTAHGWMGFHLREQYGDAMRVLGFSFYQGSFTAVNLDAGLLGTYSLGPASGDSYEYYFHAAEIPRFILDLRVETSTDATSWLAGPRPFREIGCCHRPSVLGWGVRLLSLPELYDAIVFYEDTHASQMLPAVWD